eukprot:187602-Amphidinium_carterae.1
MVGFFVLKRAVFREGGGFIDLGKLELAHNHLAGPLPERGLSSLTALRNFNASFNALVGTLPETGLQGLTALDRFVA